MSPHSKSWFLLQIVLAVVSNVVLSLGGLNSPCLLLFILSLHFIKVVLNVLPYFLSHVLLDCSSGGCSN